MMKGKMGTQNVLKSLKEKVNRKKPSRKKKTYAITIYF